MRVGTDIVRCHVEGRNQSCCPVCVRVRTCVFVCVCERQTCSLVQCHTAAGSEVIQANGREIASRETTTLQQIENVCVEDK